MHCAWLKTLLRMTSYPLETPARMAPAAVTTNASSRMRMLRLPCNTHTHTHKQACQFQYDEILVTNRLPAQSRQEPENSPKQLLWCHSTSRFSTSPLMFGSALCPGHLSSWCLTKTIQTALCQLIHDQELTIHSSIQFSCYHPRYPTHTCMHARTHTHTHTHIHTTHLTVISLKMQTPQKREAKAPGPVVMMGKATGSDSTLLAMNQHPVATAHMMPEAMAGRITLGYTWGWFFLQAM